MEHHRTVYRLDLVPGCSRHSGDLHQVEAPSNPRGPPGRCDTVRRNNRRRHMKRHLMSAACVVLLSGWIASIAFAQATNPNAQSHVAAARALAYEPGHDYTGS